VASDESFGRPVPMGTKVKAVARFSRTSDPMIEVRSVHGTIRRARQRGLLLLFSATIAQLRRPPAFDRILRLYGGGVQNDAQRCDELTSQQHQYERKVLHKIHAFSHDPNCERAARSWNASGASRARCRGGHGSVPFWHPDQNGHICRTIFRRLSLYRISPLRD
jgi:hypothetical protein